MTIFQVSAFKAPVRNFMDCVVMAPPFVYIMLFSHISTFNFKVKVFFKFFTFSQIEASLRNFTVFYKFMTFSFHKIPIFFNLSKLFFNLHFLEYSDFLAFKGLFFITKF